MSAAVRPAPAPSCSTAEHQAIKRDDAAWQSLEFRGYQYDDDGKPAEEVRDCPCGSTLYRPIKEAPCK